MIVSRECNNCVYSSLLVSFTILHKNVCYVKIQNFHYSKLNQWRCSKEISLYVMIQNTAYTISSSTGVDIIIPHQVCKIRQFGGSYKNTFQFLYVRSSLKMDSIKVHKPSKIKIKYCIHLVWMRELVKHVWNVMAHAQKPYLAFQPNRRVHLNRPVGASVQSTSGSRGVRHQL